MYVTYDLDESKSTQLMECDNGYIVKNTVFLCLPTPMNKEW